MLTEVEPDTAHLENIKAVNHLFTINYVKSVLKNIIGKFGSNCDKCPLRPFSRENMTFDGFESALSTVHKNTRVKLS